jgi:glutamate racemase
MPSADLLYLGDTVHLPYGEKPPALLRKYAEDAFSFFGQRAVSALVVACGTISTVVLETHPPKTDFPILGVARPAAMRLRELRCRRIAVLATAATVASCGYVRLLRELDAEVLQLACPHLVPIAESGTALPSPQLMRLVDRELHPLRDFSPDAILLGCTHFPLFSEVIATLYPSAALVDCGRAAADLLDPALYGEGSGQTSYYVTGSADRFRCIAERILPSAITEGVHQIDLETKNK